jgi:hypothetical protein
MRAIIEEFGEAAPRKAAAVIEALPQDFPVQLVDSVMTAINQRSRLLAAFNAGAVPR